MDFLSTLQWNARRRFPDTARSRIDRYATPVDHPLAVFLVAVAVLFALTQWLLANGYVDENALSIWAKILALRDAPEARIEFLGFGYTHGPIYLTMLASFVPGLSAPVLPYQLSAIFAALVLAYWYRLIRPHMPVWAAWSGILLIALNPLFLWSATSSLQSSLGLGVFFAVCLNIMWLPVGYTPQAYLRLGSLLALLFLVDERALYLLPGLFLLISAALPRDALTRSPFAMYLLIFTPIALAVLAWAYLNWLFLGDPFDFLRAADSTFLGAWLDYPYTPWLVDHGGGFVLPVLVALAMQLAAFPALLILGFRAIGRRWPLRTGLIVYGTLALAVGLSTLHGTLSHPAVYISLTFAGLAVGFHHLRVQTKGARLLAAVTLAAGIFGGWAVLNWEATTRLERWTNAITGNQQPQLFEAEHALANWLRDHPGPTLLDDRDGYAVVADLGATRDLILPFSSEYKLALRRDRLTVVQVAVLDPARSRGLSPLRVRFPDLYSRGMSGYERVYDAEGWRVYRRRDPTAAAAVRDAGGAHATRDAVRG